MREIFSLKDLDRKAIVFFGAIILLIVLGPFGTYEIFGVWERTVYWAAIMMGVGFFMHILVLVALRTPLLGRAGQFIRIPIGCILAGLPGAVVVIIVDQLMRSPGVDPDNLPYLWAQVSLIGIVIASIEYADWGGSKAQEPAPVTTRFHSRLTPEMGQIISLSMQDHYVEVTCEHGTEMILIRMGDAIAELDGLKGTQTHRSHWVARDAITRLGRSGQKAHVELKDGRSLPVSATYLDRVKTLIGES